jgi:hypothetical protein
VADKCIVRDHDRYACNLASHTDAMSTSNHDERLRGAGRVLMFAVAPTILIMIYAAVSGMEIHTVSKGWRPQTSAALTWAETPVRFVLNGLMLYVAVAFIMLVAYMIARLVWELVRGKR